MIESGGHAYYWQRANGLASLSVCQFSQVSQGSFLKPNFRKISLKLKCGVVFCFILFGRVKFRAGKG